MGVVRGLDMAWLAKDTYNLILYLIFPPLVHNEMGKIGKGEAKSVGTSLLWD